MVYVKAYFHFSIPIFHYQRYSNSKTVFQSWFKYKIIIKGKGTKGLHGTKLK